MLIADGGVGGGYVPPIKQDPPPPPPPGNQGATYQPAYHHSPGSTNMGSVRAAERRAQLALLEAAQRQTDAAMKRARELKDKYIQDYRNGKATEAQAKELDEAYGKALGEASHEMRVAAQNAVENGGDPQAAIDAQVKDIKARSGDPLFNEHVDDVAASVKAESVQTRQTRIAGYKLGVAAEALDAQPNNPTAQANFVQAQQSFELALTREMNVIAAQAELDAAKAWLKQVQESGGGMYELSEANQAVSAAKRQLERAEAGLDIDVSTTSRDAGIAAVKARYATGSPGMAAAIDAIGIKEKLKLELKGIDPNDPTLTPQEKKLAETDPTALALARLYGIRIDPADPSLTAPERQLARDNPYQFVLLKIAGKVTGNIVDPSKITDPVAQQQAIADPLAYTIMQMTDAQKMQFGMIEGVTFLVRMDYTRSRVSELMSRDEWRAALKLTQGAMDASLTPEERKEAKAQLYDPFFTKDFWQKKIDYYKTHRDGVPEGNGGVKASSAGNNLGIFLEDLMKETPLPEAADDLLTLIMADDTKWGRSEDPVAGTNLILFYRSLAALVEVDAAGGRDRSGEVANYLLTNENANQVVMAFRTDGYQAMREAAGNGHTLLSQTLFEQMKRDRPGMYDTDDMTVRQALNAGVQNYNTEVVASEQYKAFQQAPSLYAQDAFDSFLRPVGGMQPTLLQGPQQLTGAQRRNLIGAMLWQAPTTGKTGTHEDRYDGDVREKLIKPIEEKIIELGGENAVVTYVPVLYVSPGSGEQHTALFIVEGKDGKKHLVDDRGWDYEYDESKPLDKRLQDYRENNALSDKGTIYLPKDLRLQDRGDGHADVISFGAHHTTGTERALKVVDIVVGVAAAAAGIGLTIVSGGAAIPLWIAVGAGAGYGAYRAGDGLLNIHQHGGDLTSHEALSQWMMLVSSVAGVGATGIGFRSATYAFRANAYSSLANKAAAAGNTTLAEARAASATAAGARLDSRAWQLTGSVFNKVAGYTGGFVMVDQGAALMSTLGQPNVDGSDTSTQWLMMGLGIAQIAIGRARSGGASRAPTRLQNASGKNGKQQTTNVPLTTGKPGLPGNTSTTGTSGVPAATTVTPPIKVVVDPLTPFRPGQSYGHGAADLPPFLSGMRSASGSAKPTAEGDVANPKAGDATQTDVGAQMRKPIRARRAAAAGRSVTPTATGKKDVTRPAIKVFGLDESGVPLPPSTLGDGVSWRDASNIVSRKLASTDSDGGVQSLKPSMEERALLLYLMEQPAAGATTRFIVSAHGPGSVIYGGKGVSVPSRRSYESLEDAKLDAAQRGGAWIYRYSPQTATQTPQKIVRAAADDIMGAVHVNAKGTLLPMAIPNIASRAWQSVSDPTPHPFPRLQRFLGGSPKNTSIRPATMTKGTVVVKAAAFALDGMGIGLPHALASGAELNLASYAVSGGSRLIWMSHGKLTKEALGAATEGNEAKALGKIERVVRRPGLKGAKLFNIVEVHDLRADVRSVTELANNFRTALADWKTHYAGAPSAKEFRLRTIRSPAETFPKLSPDAWMRTASLERFYAGLRADPSSEFHGQSVSQIRATLLSRIDKMSRTDLESAVPGKAVTPEQQLLANHPDVRQRFIDTVEVRLRLSQTHQALFNKLLELLPASKASSGGEMRWLGGEPTKQAFALATAGRKAEALQQIDAVIAASGQPGKIALTAEQSTTLRAYVERVADLATTFRADLQAWRGAYSSAPSLKKFRLRSLSSPELAALKLGPISWVSELSHHKFYTELSKEAGGEFAGQKPQQIRNALLQRLGAMTPEQLNTAASRRSNAAEDRFLVRYRDVAAQFANTYALRQRVTTSHEALFNTLAEASSKVPAIEPNKAEGLPGSANTPGTRLGLRSRQAAIVLPLSLSLSWLTKTPYVGSAWTTVGYTADLLTGPSFAVKYVYSKKVDALADFNEQYTSSDIAASPRLQEIKNKLQADKDKWNAYGDYSGGFSAARALMVGAGFFAIGMPVPGAASLVQAGLTAAWVFTQRTPAFLTPKSGRPNVIVPQGVKQVARWSTIVATAAVPVGQYIYMKLNKDEFDDKEKDKSIIDRLGGGISVAWNAVASTQWTRGSYTPRPMSLDPDSGVPRLDVDVLPPLYGEVDPDNWLTRLQAPVPQREYWQADGDVEDRSSFTQMAEARARQEGLTYNEALDQLFNLNPQYQRVLMDGHVDPVRLDDPDSLNDGGLVTVGLKVA